MNATVWGVILICASVLAGLIAITLRDMRRLMADKERREKEAHA